VTNLQGIRLEAWGEKRSRRSLGLPLLGLLRVILFIRCLAPRFWCILPRSTDL
jgi:hypothetical protein